MASQSKGTIEVLRRSWEVLDAPVRRDLIWTTGIPFLLTAALLIYALLPGFVAYNAPQLLSLSVLIIYIGPLPFVLIVIAVIPYRLLFKAHHMIRARFLEIRYPGETDALRAHWSTKDGLLLGVWLISVTVIPMNVLGLVHALLVGSLLSLDTVRTPVWIALGILSDSPCCHRYILMDEGASGARYWVTLRLAHQG